MSVSGPKILVPTDYSACSSAVLRHAVSLARDEAASLLVLHVAAPGATTNGGLPIDPKTALEQADLRTLLASLCGDQRLAAYEHRVVVGEAVEQIVDVAKREQATLIVMGTKGRTGVKRLLMGSVAEAVASQAPCPVLIYRGAADSDGARQPLPQDVRNAAEPAPPDETPSFMPDEGARDEIDDSPAIGLLTRAINMRATDVHLDPVGEEFEVRFRVDGRLRHYCRLGREVGHGLMTQLKVLGELDITEPFAPKEGRLQLPASLSGHEVRMTTMRASGGEAASLRLLSRGRLLRPLDELGLATNALRLVQQMLQKTEGLILITGPSGSGKTTTAYSMIHGIDDGQRNIVSVEDPVEYTIPSIRQLHADPKHHVTMTSALRTLLRLDPDVVLIGEIRDPETAVVAMRAANSGKYCFSTLHTRDVAATITALRDLGIDNRSLAGNLAGIISQRLVRRLCQQCRRREPLAQTDAVLFQNNGVETPEVIYQAVGCPHCQGSGYFDRVGVFEVVLPERDFSEAMVQGSLEEELRDLIRSHGTPSLVSDSLRKVTDGVTTLDEVRRMHWVEIC
jgi:type II secretory ATPase GspE/PulE/Tfp pilus assembly ATPase PilB-like protein/nucleotide-binding universal stress UspA family protein